MGRPKTVNARIKDLPRGMRKVGHVWYWRPTDEATRVISVRLAELGISSAAGKTPAEARRWWEQHVSPILLQMTPDGAVAGTMEEIFRHYEADELPNLKREQTRDLYKVYLRLLRADFASMRYPRTEEEAMRPGFLRNVTVQKYLHANRKTPYATNRRIELLSRMFRLAKVRWGLTAYNPCADIEYLPEQARDVYVDDKTYVDVTDAGSELFRIMASISQMTGARIGSVYTIAKDQIRADGLVIRVGKKKNAKGYVETVYNWTDDLKAEVQRALELREKAPGTPEKKDPKGPLFLNRFGKAYSQEAYKSAWSRVRKKLNIGAREITVHDLGRAKAVSDSPSDEAGKELVNHESVGVTRRHYRRKAKVVQPMPAVKRTPKKATT